MKEVEHDPSLTSELLKLANSTAYFTSNKIESVQKAVNIIGIKMVRQMALAHSSRKILEENLPAFEGFWENSTRVSFYARQLAIDLEKKDLSDFAFLGGLLSGIGNILLHSVDPETIRKINGLVINKSEGRLPILEEISLGISHAEVGAKLAEKWNFSEEIIEIIRNHQSPFSAKPEFQEVVALVHLANSFIAQEKKKQKNAHIEVEALEILGITSGEDLNELHEKIRKLHEVEILSPA